MTVLYPRPGILAEIPLDRHTVIEASAGTGKTFTIEHLVVELLLRSDVPIEQVLVLTFTERATTELRARIRAMLARILAHPPGTAPVAGGSWVVDDRARRRLEAALLGFDTASIHTIHGFFQRVLTSNAFPIGRPLVQEMVDGKEAFGRAFLTTLRSRASTDPLLQRHVQAWIHEEQRTVEELQELVYGCLLHHRRGARFWPEYVPERLTALLRAVVLPPLVEGKQLKEGTSVHGATARAVVKRLEWLAGVISSYRSGGDLLETLRQLSVLDRSEKRTRHRLDILHDKLSMFGGSGPAGRWLALVDELRGNVVGVDSAVVQALVPEIVSQLDRDRAGRGQFDYDDLIRLVWEALEGPGAEQLATTLRSQYRYALIDEFQDTDDLQWRIFQRLFFEGRAGHACYLVGDPKQAIYGFRGADVNAYLAATRHVASSTGSRPVVLDRSFRSTGRLLDALNTLFEQEAPEPFFTGPDIVYRQPVQCGKPELQLTAAGGQAVAPVVVLRVTPTDTRLRVDSVRRALARCMAEDLRSMLAQGSPHGLRIGTPAGSRPVKASDVFVLTRSAAEGVQIGQALRDAGVPHAFYKQDGLFATAEARDVRDLLMGIDDPGDRSRRLKAWLTPFFDVPLSSLATLADLPDTHPLVQRLEEWHELSRRGEHERLFAALADESGVVMRLLESGAQRELTNILHVLEILLGRAQSGARARDLVLELTEYIEGRRLPPGEDSDVQRLESDREAVQIMTVHKSKGLEADVVYVFGGFSVAPVRGTTPVTFHDEADRRLLHVGRSSEALARASTEQDGERQRLLYVALTRARGRVVLPLLSAAALPSIARSPYEPVNRRLSQVIEAGTSPELFDVREVRALASSGGGEVERPRVSNAPAAIAWPDPPDEAGERSRMRDLAVRHGPLEVTSYTRIKSAHGGYEAPEDPDEFKADGPGPAGPPPEADPLPGGRAMGVLLHEIIECLPLESLLGPPPLADWSARPDVRQVLDETLARHGCDEQLRPAIERLLHRSLTAPVRLGDLALEGIASAGPCAREMAFVFPYPEQSHPPLGDSPDRPLVIERGYVQGVIDLIFVLQGRTFFADWKTDILRDYSRAALTDHVARNYRVQAGLYALATVKMLGIRDRAGYEARFGGLLYCFLRGMGTADASGEATGVHFERPDWDELVAFDRRMRAGEALE